MERQVRVPTGTPTRSGHMCHKGLFTQEAFVAPAAFSMERLAGREAKRPVKRAHSRDTVASMLVERMRAHLETVGIDENQKQMQQNWKPHLKYVLVIQ